MESDIVKYTVENGRIYYTFKEGKYMLPNNELEKIRLDLQSHLFRLTLGKLFLSPLDPAKLRKVLNIGTRTRIQAINVGDDFPYTQVIGIDLSPIQLDFNLLNFIFKVDDIEDTWTFKGEEFDFIYARDLVGSISDQLLFFQQSFG